MATELIEDCKKTNEKILRENKIWDNNFFFKTLEKTLQMRKNVWRYKNKRIFERKKLFWENKISAKIII